jgi:hypothetical protein
MSARRFRIEKAEICPMRQGSSRASKVIALSAITVLTTLGVAAAQDPNSRLAQLGTPYHLQLAQGLPQAQAAATPKAYKTIAITASAPAGDPSFDAFRKQLADIAKRKDRPGLARIVVAQGFFWEGESGDKADKKKSGVDNLAVAIGLDGQDGFGWDALSAAALEPTLEPYAERKGVMCGPASPQFDDKALDEVTKATQTDMSEWGFPTKGGLEVRATAQATAPVIEKLGPNLIRVMPEDPPPASNQPPPFMRVVTPSGKVGYVPVDTIAPLASDQMCYLKDASGWKIAGYIGGQ